MRILVLTETVPYPLDAGGRIKTFNTLRILARVHDVRLQAFIRDDAQRASREPLEALGVPTTLHLLQRSWVREAGYLVRSLAGPPYTVLRHFDRGASSAIARAAREWRPDIVYADHLSMAGYARRLGLPVVYDAHNVEHAVLRRFASTRRDPITRIAAAIEWRRVRRYEAEVCRASRLVLIVSDVDRLALQVLAGASTPFAVVPISVDAAAVTPLAAPPAGGHVLFLGGLHWPPNADALAWFVQSCWPAIRSARPGATLVSVGRDDAPVAAVCRGVPGVTLTGHVPDIAPHVAGSRVLVVPMRAGSGMRVKILEAMARGVPVVTTSVGVEGIDAMPGVHLLVADAPSDFASAVLRVLGDDALAARLAREARALVLARYDVAAVERTLLGAIEQAASTGREVLPGAD